MCVAISEMFETNLLIECMRSPEVSGVPFLGALAKTVN